MDWKSYIKPLQRFQRQALINFEAAAKAALEAYIKDRSTSFFLFNQGNC